MYNTISDSIIIGKKVVFLPSCHSTNAIAAELVHNLVFENGTIVITNNQTQGKGQRGTIWLTEPGLNLTFTILLRKYALAVSDQFLLSQAVALGIVEYIKNRGIEAFIKWPNDIYVSSKKIGGTLIENSIQGVNISSSLIGIGLNMNQTIFPYPYATSLSLEIGAILELGDEFEKLVKSIDNYLNILLLGDYRQIKAQYLENLLGLGEEREFRIGTVTTMGTIVGISNWGKLLFKSTDSLKILEFDIKEIEWIW